MDDEQDERALQDTEQQQRETEWVSKRIALFRDSLGFECAWDRTPSLGGWIQSTEWASVEFKRLPDSSVIKDQIRAIESEVDEAKKRLDEKLAALESRKSRIASQVAA